MKEIIYREEKIKIERQNLQDANGRYFFNIKIIDDYTKANGFFYREEDAIKQAKKDIDEILDY